MLPLNRCRPLRIPILILLLLNAAGAFCRGDDTGLRTGVVRAGVLNVRARPGTRYEVVCQLREGEEVVIMDETDEWYEILVPARASAWVAERFVAAGGRITGDRVRVHSGPGLVFTTYAYVNTDDRVTVLNEVRNGWQKIEPPKGATAWVSSRYVDAEAVPDPEEMKTVGVAAEEAAETDEEAAAAPDTASAAPVAGAEDRPAVVRKDGVASAEQGRADSESDSAAEEKTAAAQEDGPADAVAEAGAAAEEDAVDADMPEGPESDAPAAPGDREERSEDAERAQAEAAPPDGTEAEDAAAAAPDASGGEPEREEAGTADATAEAAKAADDADEGQTGEEEIPGQADASLADPPPAGAPPDESPSGTTPTGEEAEETTQDEVVRREGLVMELDNPAPGVATHTLSVRMHDTLYPVCYLNCESGAIDLSDWELQPVRVYGREVRYPGWQRPVLEIHGIQLQR